MRTVRRRRMLQGGVLFSGLAVVVMGIIVIGDIRSFASWVVLIASLLNTFTFWELLRTDKPAG